MRAVNLVGIAVMMVFISPSLGRGSCSGCADECDWNENNDEVLGPCIDGHQKVFIPHGAKQCFFVTIDSKGRERCTFTYNDCPGGWMEHETVDC